MKLGIADRIRVRDAVTALASDINAHLEAWFDDCYSDQIKIQIELTRDPAHNVKVSADVMRHGEHEEEIGCEDVEVTGD